MYMMEKRVLSRFSKREIVFYPLQSGEQACALAQKIAKLPIPLSSTQEEKSFIEEFNNRSKVLQEVIVS